MHQDTTHSPQDLDQSQYHGPPLVSAAFNHQLALHLHRYLAPWLEHHTVKHLWLTVGFARTNAEVLHYRVSLQGAEAADDLPWTLDKLTRLTENPGTASTHIDQPADQEQAPPRRLRLLRLKDDIGGNPKVPDGPLGFVLVDAGAAQGAGREALDALRGRCAEAIRAARRNSVRLTLEETTDHRLTSIKHTLYQVLGHLPEWIGVDHSASVLITHSIRDTVHLHPDQTEGEDQPGDEAEAPEYDVMAERLFFTQAEAPDRLVGLSWRATPQNDGLLACALQTQRQQPARRYHRFIPTSNQPAPEAWRGVDAEGAELQAQELQIERPLEGRVILVPLTSIDPATRAPELLGWLRLAWRHTAYLPASTATLLGQIADALAGRLRSSEAFTLSARQLMLLEDLRRDLTDTLSTPLDDDEDPRDAFVARVVSRIARATGLPSFSIGQLRDAPEGRLLRFVHPHGWSHMHQLELAIDQDEPTNTGVVGLAVRMKRPIVLAGGSPTETRKAWNNTLWVHEAQGLLADQRRLSPDLLQAPGWRRLSDYYRSAHDGTYATLAFPILLGDEPLGVVAVEVERTTTWLWWSGLGSQLFYRLLTAELATSLRLLGGLQASA